MKVLEVNTKNKKAVEDFDKREWARFNKEKGYKWNEKKYLFIVKDKNKIIGTSEINITGGAAYLKKLIVEKEKRRTGAGTLLMKKFEQLSLKENCHVAYLKTTNKHKEALKFYKKQGYKIKAKLKDNEFHFDAYFLEKRLK